MEHTWIKVDDPFTLPKHIIGVYRLTCPCGKVYIGMSEKSILKRWRAYFNISCNGKTKQFNQPKLEWELIECKDFYKWKIEYIELPLEDVKKTENELIETTTPKLNILNYKLPMQMVNTKTNEEITVLGFQNVMGYFDKNDPIRFKHPYDYVLNRLSEQKCYYDSEWRVKDINGRIIDTPHLNFYLQQKANLKRIANLLKIEKEKINIEYFCHFCNIAYGKPIRINAENKDLYKYWFCKECLMLKENWKTIRKLKGFDWWEKNQPKTNRKKWWED